MTTPPETPSSDDENPVPVASTTFSQDIQSVEETAPGRSETVSRAGGWAGRLRAAFGARACRQGAAGAWRSGAASPRFRAEARRRS